jgi:hypothetical protein
MIAMAALDFFLFPESYSALEGKVNEQHVPNGKLE